MKKLLICLSVFTVLNGIEPCTLDLSLKSKIPVNQPSIDVSFEAASPSGVDKFCSLIEKPIGSELGEALPQVSATSEKLLPEFELELLEDPGILCTWGPSIEF